MSKDAQTSESPHRARFELALSLAQQAGEVAMRLYQSSAMSWVAKADGSQVTPADKECEALIRRGIGATFPQDAILGEEFGESAGQGGGAAAIAGSSTRSTARPRSSREYRRSRA